MSDWEFVQHLWDIVGWILRIVFWVSFFLFLQYRKLDDASTRYWFRMAVVWGIIMLMAR